MSDQFGRRFDPGELGGPDGPSLSDAELADDMAMARDLELFARAEQPSLSTGFEDRVMAALADEPAPRGAFASTGRRRSIVAVVVDAWRVATTPGRPMAMRAQALALVLIVAVAIGSLGTAAAVGVANLLSSDPAPTEVPSPTPSLPPGPSPTPDPSPAPSVPPSPALPPSPSPSADDSPEPNETPEGEGGVGRTATPTATGDDDDETPEPAETLKPGETLEPGETLKPGDDDS